MSFEEIVLSLITLLFFLLIMMNPLLKRLLMRAGWSRSTAEEKETSEDAFYERVDSHRVMENLREERGEAPEKAEMFDSPSPEEKVHPSTGAPPASLERIDRLSPLKRAFLWKEILSPPLGLGETGDP